jgi:hypothetical protein
MTTGKTWDFRLEQRYGEGKLNKLDQLNEWLNDKSEGKENLKRHNFVFLPFFLIVPEMVEMICMSLVRM